MSDKLGKTELGQQEFDRWKFWDEDARLVQEEAEQVTEEQKAFLAAEEALTEFDAYMHSLSIEDAETALNGLREYADHFRDDIDIVQGGFRHLE